MPAVGVVPVVAAAAELSGAARMNEYVAAFAALAPILGGGIAWVWRTLEGRRKATRDELLALIAACDRDKQELAGRLGALEILQSSDMPRWVRDKDGVILSVSPEFVRVFGAPHKYGTADLLGKRFGDLTAFSPDLLRTLQEMDDEALAWQYSSRAAVRVSDRVTASIHKAVVKGVNGDVLYVGVAVPVRWSGAAGGSP